jgi:transcriptional regulator with XRE-family HTH domain
MDFYNWIEQKYIDWRGSSRKTISEFATYIGVSQPTVSAWMNKSRGKPTSRKVIDALAQKFPEAYDILGLSQPSNTETDDPDLQAILANWDKMTPEFRRYLAEQSRSTQEPKTKPALANQ